MLEEFVLFLLCFFVVLFVYEVFIVNRAKKKKNKKEPMEVRYLVTRYHLDMKKVNYNQLLQIVAIVSSFDIALLVSIVVYINSYLWQIVAVLILVFPVILISYHFVGVFYRKKGMVKDGKY